MPRQVTVVRHALPEARSGTEPEKWPLGAAGRRAARRLRGRLPAGVLASSPEKKAIETLCLAAGVTRDDLRLDPGFGEVQRSEPFDDHYRSRRSAWVRGEPDGRHDGWETADEAARRFQAAVDRIDDDLVVATHGMVVTAWLVSRGELTPGAAAAAFWDGLGYPAVFRVELG